MAHFSPNVGRIVPAAPLHFHRSASVAFCFEHSGCGYAVEWNFCPGCGKDLRPEAMRVAEALKSSVAICKQIAGVEEPDHAGG